MLIIVIIANDRIKNKRIMLLIQENLKLLTDFVFLYQYHNVFIICDVSSIPITFHCRSWAKSKYAHICLPNKFIYSIYSSRAQTGQYYIVYSNEFNIKPYQISGNKSK